MAGKGKVNKVEEEERAEQRLLWVMASGSDQITLMGQNPSKKNSFDSTMLLNHVLGTSKANSRIMHSQ